MRERFKGKRKDKPLGKRVTRDSVLKEYPKAVTKSADKMKLYVTKYDPTK
jgi:hypothetical protein